MGRNTLRPLDNRYNESGGLAGVEVDVVMQENNGWEMQGDVDWNSGELREADTGFSWKKQKMADGI